MNDVSLLNWQTLAWQLAQMTCLIPLAWLVIRLVGRNRPHFSHVVCLVVLAKCLLPPVWNHSAGLFPKLADQLGFRSEKTPTTGRNEKLTDTGIETADNVVVTPADDFTAAVRGINSASPRPIDSPAPAATSLGTRLVSGWLISVAVIGAVVVVRIVRLLGSLRRSRIDSPPELDELVVRLRSQLGIRRKVRLLVTSQRVGPAVIGFFRPVLVLPEIIVRESTPDEIEPIVAHELLHIRRGDLWVGLLQMLAEIVWWFYPLVKGLNRILTREAERCCDEEVIAELGYSPMRYARCLLNVLERKQKLEPVPAFPGVRAVELTRQRMERIMTLKEGIRQRTPWWCWIIGLGLGLLVLPGGMGAAQQPPLATKATATTAPASAKNAAPPRHAPVRETPSALSGVGVNSDAGVTGTLNFQERRTGTPIGLSGPPTLSQPPRPVASVSPLDRKVAVEFNRTPLSDALEQLADAAELELLLDADALKREGLTTNLVVNFSTEKLASIREILSRILKPHDLVFLLEEWTDETGAKSSRLRVTNRARVDGELVVMTYPVADLVIPWPHVPPTFIGPIGSAWYSDQLTTFWKTPDSNKNLPTRSSSAPAPARGQSQPLIELIRKTIEPESWNEANGVGSLAFAETTLSLVVRHRRDVHRQIADLLSSLRNEQGLQITIESRLFDVPEDVLPDECRERLDRACTDSRTGKPLSEKTLQDLLTMVEQFDELEMLSSPKVTTFNNRGVSVQVSGQFDPATQKASADSFSLLIVPTMSADQKTIEMKLAVNAADTYDAILRLQTFSTADGSAVLLDVTEGSLQHGVDEVTRRLQKLENKRVGKKRYLLLKPTTHRE